MSLDAELVAWMGGTPPRPYGDVAGEPEGAYVSRLYSEQIDTWENNWNEPCPSDLHSIFWRRARYDAHATYRAKVKA